MQSSTTWWLHIIGRLRAGISPEQARTNLSPIFRAFLQDAMHEAPPGVSQAMEDQFVRQQIALSNGGAGLSHLRKQFREPLLILMGAALLVLFVMCLNLANMLLARGTTRRREMAIRLALGAGRFRLIRQLLTESVLLATIGGLTGFAVGSAAENLLAVCLPHLARLQLNGGIHVIFSPQPFPYWEAACSGYYRRFK